MDKPRCDIFNVKLPTGCPEVSFIIPVALHISIYRSNQGETPDVELPTLIEKGSLDVFLNYVAALVSVDLGVVYYLSDRLQISADLDATALICIFSRLDDPDRLSVAPHKSRLIYL
jgi:hypothetical protein